MATTPNPFDDQIQTIKNDSQYTANTNTFDEANGTAGRVDSIIAKDSPLMQRAASKANQTMNARGLMNSSMAVGAGQAAVMDAAVPIASTDAQLFSQQKLANQTSLNDAARANAEMRGTIGMKGVDLKEQGRQFDVSEAGTNTRFNTELEQQDRQFDANQAGMTDRLMKELDSRVELAGIDRDTKLAIVQAQTDSQNLIAGNENIAKAWGTVMDQIGQIQNNPDLDATTKTQLIQNTLAGFQSFTGFWQKASGGAVDVSDLLKFNVTTTGSSDPETKQVDTGPVMRDDGYSSNDGWDRYGITWTG